MSHALKILATWQVLFMANFNQDQLAVSGIGVTSAIGQGKNAFFSSLMTANSCFKVMSRPGRQIKESAFLGAEIASLTLPDAISGGLLRTSSFTAQVALATLSEAWTDANLQDVDPTRIGLIIGGSNVQQRELVLMQQQYQDRVSFLRPTYAMSFMDTDICGLCTEVFGIQGPAISIGAASASGQMAVIQAAHLLRSGQVDVCIAMGALMDLSYWECQGFRSAGAMGSDKFATEPESACRPFDLDHDGFIFGEACGAVVLERTGDLPRSTIKPYARLLGYSANSDANRNPNPSHAGETAAIRSVLDQAKLSATDIDYINPHGTGSIIGDETELKALSACGLNKASINATKSITGHGLTAAGNIELIATMLQMREGKLHPTKNLSRPIDDSFSWITDEGHTKQIVHALKLSMGFGGINTAICLQRW